MHVFKDKVAVITGAASGIGRAIANRCAQEGMKLVMADIETGALARAEQELIVAGGTVRAIPTDVSSANDVEALADLAYANFGSVDLLVNNAGVGSRGMTWEQTLADWEWVLGVNLWGVIHGIRTFVPRMIAQNSEGHIVNTASITGLTSNPQLGPHNVSNHGVVTLSETLYHELKLRRAKIGVSVLCPAWVRTNLLDSERNRPADLQNNPGEAPLAPDTADFDQRARKAAQSGISPAQVANDVFRAIAAGKFYILTHPEARPAVQERMENILAGRNPTMGVIG